MILSEEIEINLGSKVEEASHVKVAICPRRSLFTIYNGILFIAILKIGRTQIKN